MNEEFWRLLEEMIEDGEIVIDRPKASRHPRFPDMVYPADYGYLKGTRSMDGEGIDVWLGSKEEQLLEGLICTADRLKGDSEIKLLIGCTAEEMHIIHAFHNDSRFMKGLLILRHV